MKIVVPERVLEAAETAYFDAPVGPEAPMKAAITAALQEWIASGDARPGSMYESDHAWYAQTLQVDPEHKSVLIIRMEPDND